MCYLFLSQCGKKYHFCCINKKTLGRHWSGFLSHIVNKPVAWTIQCIMLKCIVKTIIWPYLVNSLNVLSAYDIPEIEKSLPKMKIWIFVLIRKLSNSNLAIHLLMKGKCKLRVNFCSSNLSFSCQSLSWICLSL